MHRYLAYVWHFRMASDLASRLGAGRRVFAKKEPIDRTLKSVRRFLAHFGSDACAGT